MHIVFKCISGQTLFISVSQSNSISDAFNYSSFSEPFENYLSKRFNCQEFGKIPKHYMVKMFRFFVEGELSNFLDLNKISKLNCVLFVVTPYINRYIISCISYIQFLDYFVNPYSRILPNVAVRIIANYLFVNPSLYIDDNEIYLRITNRNIRNRLISILSSDLEYKSILLNLPKSLTKVNLSEIEFKIVQLAMKNNKFDQKKLSDSNLIRKIRKTFF